MIPVTQEEFRFATDEQSLDYLRAIVEFMMASFGISREECIGRINNSWSHVTAVVGEEDYVYHETPDYWANHFYYGKDSCWWVDAAVRARLGLPALRPLLWPPE